MCIGLSTRLSAWQFAAKWGYFLIQSGEILKKFTIVILLSQFFSAIPTEKLAIVSILLCIHYVYNERTMMMNKYLNIKSISFG